MHLFMIKIDVFWLQVDSDLEPEDEAQVVPQIVLRNNPENEPQVVPQNVPENEPEDEAQVVPQVAPQDEAVINSI